MARATGSYPVGHGFKSNLRYQRPVGQAAKTPPFHGGNGSSILPRVTNKKEMCIAHLFFLLVTLPKVNAPQAQFARIMCLQSKLPHAFLRQIILDKERHRRSFILPRSVHSTSLFCRDSTESNRAISPLVCFQDLIPRHTQKHQRFTIALSVKKRL